MKLSSELIVCFKQSMQFIAFFVTILTSLQTYKSTNINKPTNLHNKIILRINCMFQAIIHSIVCSYNINLQTCKY